MEVAVEPVDVPELVESAPVVDALVVDALRVTTSVPVAVAVAVAVALALVLIAPHLPGLGALAQALSQGSNALSLGKAVIVTAIVLDDGCIGTAAAHAASFVGMSYSVA